VRRTTPANCRYVSRLPGPRQSVIWSIIVTLALSSALGLQHALFAQSLETKNPVTKSTEKQAAKSSRLKSVGAKEQTSKLPSGFNPPQQILPVMTLEKELLTKQEEARFRKTGLLKRYRDSLKSLNPTEKDKDAIAQGAVWHLKRMSMKKYRNALPSLRQEILRDLLLYARQSPAARKELLQQLTSKSELLFDNNFYVRLNAVILLTQLNLVEPKGDVELVAYVPVAKPLLKIVKDKKQLDPIKVQAVKGLTRICRLGALPLTDEIRPEIAVALVAELARQGTHWWYQMRLAEGLAACGVASNPSNRDDAMVVNSLSQTMSNEKRHWIARSAAAKALGRVPLEKAANHSLESLVYWTIELAYRMSQDFDKNPEQSFWRVCYENVYLAFHALNTDESKRRAGFLQKGGGQNYVQGAYEIIVPLVKYIRDTTPPKQFPREIVRPIKDWLKRNEPPKPIPEVTETSETSSE